MRPGLSACFQSIKSTLSRLEGGASVLLRKTRSYGEVYNDLDGEVVNLFKVLRDRGHELKEKLELTPFARDEFEIGYEPCEDELERARRTVVKSFMGFGSAAITAKSPTKPGAGFKPTTGYRSTSNRSGTTPAHDWAHYPSRMPELIERLQGVCIENRDAILCMKQHDSLHTLHYVDPPYVHSTRAQKRWRTPCSYRHEMTDVQHEELCAELKSLAGMIVLSGYPNELYDSLGWASFSKSAHADGSSDRIERLWLNPAAAEQMPQRELEPTL